jgi:hypothetical protein
MTVLKSAETFSLTIRPVTESTLNPAVSKAADYASASFND